MQAGHPEYEYARCIAQRHKHLRWPPEPNHNLDHRLLEQVGLPPDRLDVAASECPAAGHADEDERSEELAQRERQLANHIEGKPGVPQPQAEPILGILIQMGDLAKDKADLEA